MTSSKPVPADDVPLCCCVLREGGRGIFFITIGIAPGSAWGALFVVFCVCPGVGRWYPRIFPRVRPVSPLAAAAAANAPGAEFY